MPSETRPLMPRIQRVCSKLRIVAAVAALGLTILANWARAGELNVSRDLPYKGDSGLGEYEQSRCKLDIYAPTDAKNLPCLVWFHGGAIQEGSKDVKTTVATCRALAEEGIVVAAVNYRLSPKALFPAYLEDAAASVAWMQKHAAEYGGDPKRVFVSGHSAGGYLAAMIAVDSHFLEKFGSSPASLAGVIPLSGQMATHYSIREERGLPKTRIIVDEAAPLFHARKDAPPLLVLYAEHDMTLRGDENRYFAAAMRAAGDQQVAIKEIPNMDHGGIGDRIPEASNPVRALIKEFIAAH